MKKMYRRVLSLFLAGSLLLGGCGLPGHDSASVSARFDAYTDQLFREEIVLNTINLHYTLAHPENYGITEYTPSLGDYNPDSVEESYQSLEEMKKDLTSFRRSALTDSQKLTYDILMDYVKTELLAKDLSLYSEVLGPTTGYQAQLPVLLAEYTFRTRQDIEDYLALLSQVDVIFQGIVSFEQKKSQAGLFMSDLVADTIIDQCQEFIKDPDNNYMIEVFNDKLSTFEGLTHQEKNDYMEQNRTLVTTEVVGAYQSLIDGLTNLKGTGHNDLGLCYYEKGKEYYEYLVRSGTGSDTPVKKLQEETLDFINDGLEQIYDAVTANPDLAEQIYEYRFALTDPQDIMEDLINKVSADFPEMEKVNYTIKYVHPSMQEHMSPAFYLTPPVDDTENNVIYINQKYMDDDIYPTIAHEGYPGHLYQTVYTSSCKLPLVRNMLSYSGYTEGWATYVEYYSYGISGLDPQLADLIAVNAAMTLGLYAYIDMGIHYDGWELSDVMDFLEQFGISDEEAAKEIFETMVAEPANYLNYFIGYLEFLNLRAQAQKELGGRFDLKEFHRFLLEIGPAPFYIIEDYMEDWMKE
mgnify:CR=1 FL=1